MNISYKMKKVNLQAKNMVNMIIKVNKKNNR